MVAPMPPQYNKKMSVVLSVARTISKIDSSGVRYVT